MIYIDSESDKVKIAKDQFYKALSCRINRKLDNPKCTNQNCQICNSRKYTFFSDNEIKDEIINFLEISNLKKILTGKPDEIEKLNDNLFEKILGSNWEKQLIEYSNSNQKQINNPKLFNLYKDLNKLFDYDWLCDLEPVPLINKDNNYSLYELASSLDIRTCTYCNRSYTNTLTTKDDKKLMRPQFDHWFPKWRYPLLTCSFFNLIPSCYTCNSSSKGKTLLNLKDHIHPYVDKESLNDFQFDYILNNISGYHIYVKQKNSNLKALKTLKEINIDRMYNAHHDELNDLIKIKNAYGVNYIKRMIKLFPKAELKELEIYRLIFGVEHNYKDFHNRPMSKFKYDILKELGIIK